MQKVLDFLEMYCQWVAVGIAAVFFLFALWQFLPGVSDPVTASLGGQHYSPGTVDPKIVEDDANPLQAAIGGTASFTAAVPAYTTQFQNKLDAKTPAAPLPEWMLSGNRFKLPPGMPAIDESQIQKDQGNNVGNRVTMLPTLPAATIDPAPTTGFEQVAANAAAPGAAVVPPAAPTPAGQPAVVPTRDVTWVRVPFTISLRKMANAFATVGVPQNTSNTTVLAVDLIRQQQLPGDAWGPEEIVGKLPTVTIRSMPPAGAQVPVLLDFATWANANEVSILQPPFFTFVGGEDPNVLKPVEAAPTADVFDPATFPKNGDLTKLKPEDRAAVLKARADQAKAKQAATPRPAAPARGGGRGAAGGGSRGAVSDREALPAPTASFAKPAAAADDASVASPFASAATNMQAAPPRRPVVSDEPDMPQSGPGQPGQAGAPAQPGQAITLAPLPQAPFNPGQANGDIQGVAYDVDAKADATYRYRIRYSIFNPIYQSQNIAANAALANQFSIIAEDVNTWSEPIEIAPLTHFFLTRKPSPSQLTVQFNVFRWQDGKVHRVSQQFGPGDSIGKVDGNVDYRTPWTLVEVRQDSSAGEPYALLMNSEGRLRRQTFAEDSASPVQKKLTADVDAAAGTTASAGAAATPGVNAAGAAANRSGADRSSVDR